MTLSPRQLEVLREMQAHLGTTRYHRSIGRLQAEGLSINGQPVRHGSRTARALADKGLITIDMRDPYATAYPVHVSIRARDLLTAWAAREANINVA